MKNKSKQQVWVLCGGELGGWQVKKDRAKKAIVRTKTQRASIAVARRIARKEGAEIVIQAEDGKIREKNSCGKR